MKTKHIVLITAFVSSTSAWSSQEYGAYGVETYPAGCCVDCNLINTIDNVKTVKDVLDAWTASGLWDSTSIYTNEKVDTKDFTDTSRQTYGADDATGGADSFDISIISTHGNRVTSTTPANSYSGVLMGDTVNGCYASTRYNMYFGDSKSPGDLEILVLDACQTVQKSIYDDNKYVAMRSTTDRFSTVLGFHGNSYDTPWGISQMHDWAYNSRISGVGENWLAERNEINWWSNDDQCATAVVWGSSVTVANDMFYNGGINDRKDTSTKSTSRYYYVDGCDPSVGDPL